jgi:1-acyl-sn-glycerol-3-phosphate acyltransferase
VTRYDVSWRIGRITAAAPLALHMRLRYYGADRIPLHGGVVLAINHFSWIDTFAFGYTCPRTILYVAKFEAIRVPGFGHLLQVMGAFPIRRGESDREAVRKMRGIVRDGHVLGVFVEGTRQKSGVPGRAQAGAAMVAINEGVPVIPGAVQGSQRWRPWRPDPVSVAWGEPMRFDGLPRNGRGYKEASAEIERQIRYLWSFLVDTEKLERPRVATPPR